MGLLDDVKKKYKSIETFKAGVKATKTPKHPRDNVALLIKNSIEYLADPSYKVKKGKQKPKAPELCYEIKDGKCVVKLKYSRQLLKVDGENDAFRCDESELADVLELIHKGVKDGKIDDQLDAIKKSRSESQKARKAKKAS